MQVAYQPTGYGGGVQQIVAGTVDFGASGTAFFHLEASGKRGRLVEINGTRQIFSMPDQKSTEDYVSGRFG